MKKDVDKKISRNGFTLAETLITLVVVGIVVAVTIPIVMNNIWEKTKAERIKNIKQKLSKSTDEMLATTGLNGYSSTEDFINAFKRHMKITQICKSEEIQKCWGSKEVILNDNEKWDISKTTTRRALKIPTSAGNYDDVIGIVTADGAPLILSYNKDCNITLKDGRVWSGDQSSSLACLSGIYDWNGGKKPNKLGEDVLNLNASAGLGSKCMFELGDVCYTAPQVIPAPMTSAECSEKKNKLGLSYCRNNDTKDYYAAAAEICGGKKNMISLDALAKIATDIYGINISSYSRISNIKKSTKASQYGLTDNVWIFSSEEGSENDAHVRTFYDTYSYYDYLYGGNGGYFRTSSNGKVMCKED